MTSAISNHATIPMTPAQMAVSIADVSGAVSAARSAQTSADQLAQVIVGAADQLGRISRGVTGLDGEALRSAAQKMQLSVAALSAGQGLESMIVAIMAEQTKQMDLSIDQAEQRVRAHFDKVKEQNLLEMKKIEERIAQIEKSENAAACAKIFGGILSIVKAIGSVLQGNFVAAAAQLAAAMMHFAGESKAALALSLAATILGGLSALSDIVTEAAKKGAEQAAAQGLTQGAGAAVNTGLQQGAEAAKQSATKAVGDALFIGATAGEAGVAGVAYVGAQHAAKAIDIQAEIQSIRAWRKEQEAENERELELMQTVAEAKQKIIQVLGQFIETNDHGLKQAQHAAA